MAPPGAGMVCQVIASSAVMPDMPKAKQASLPADDPVSQRHSAVAMVSKWNPQWRKLSRHYNK